MYSPAWVNQFGIKDTYIEFVINNVSPQGNNVKGKLNLKMEEIYRDCIPIFSEINDSAPWFYLVLSEAYS